MLTEGEEIESFEMFNRINSGTSTNLDDGEDETDLKYQKIIRDIRDNDADLFEQIKRLPKKARTARKSADGENQLLTYFRKGKIQKFFISETDEAKEIDFIAAAKQLEATPETPREKTAG